MPGQDEAVHPLIAHTDNLVAFIRNRRNDVVQEGRHNFKLCAKYRHRLGHPFDIFLEHLIEVTSGYTPEQLLPTPGHIDQIIKQTEKGTDWTIWIASPLRNRWLARKREISPSTSRLTNGELFCILLEMRDKLFQDLVINWNSVRCKAGESL
eukprot:jgi/Hompol1/3039/HPOL_006308-RA